MQTAGRLENGEALSSASHSLKAPVLPEQKQHDVRTARTMTTAHIPAGHPVPVGSTLRLQVWVTGGTSRLRSQLRDAMLMQHRTSLSNPNRECGMQMVALSQTSRQLTQQCTQRERRWTQVRAVVWLRTERAHCTLPQ